MALIAEDLLLLLLDNAAAQPGLERQRRHRVLGAAILLDLAWACRVRPSTDGDAVPAGRLVALAGDTPLDPVTGPAWTLLTRRPAKVGAAVAKLSRDAEPHLLGQLERAGQIQWVPLSAREFAYPLRTRARVEPARAALLAALFDRRPPSAPTAAAISLLHAVDGLGAVLSLNDRGWRWVHARAGEIALGSWIDESPTALAEINLAVTISALRPVLSS
ncbi:GOLPH3/VPS74 family protein [Mycolicibacterium bacteremicum]|uniref:GPP34 family phosphoprotein n=1 Tax=Mycolicibacterium bacteremicum TaxID=564198 RepID=A0A1W9YV20_MYCBA|nr:GPP34 family phosphoprotein [Mycolicibacterium bacteremicum]MCV7430927.1 GPP34 family phosphoprotein [Mycolicibacterium bacteremicum]ORA03893.1 GPP34 family phosphoprotein [Mycolicibacterium bacteremicum]